MMGLPANSEQPLVSDAGRKLDSVRHHLLSPVIWTVGDSRSFAISSRSRSTASVSSATLLLSRVVSDSVSLARLSASSLTRSTIHDASVAVMTLIRAMPAIIRPTAMHLPCHVTGDMSP